MCVCVCVCMRAVEVTSGSVHCLLISKTAELPEFFILDQRALILQSTKTLQEDIKRNTIIKSAAPQGGFE